VVRRVSGGYVVKLVADEAWLERKLRDGMVVIDPEVSTGAALVPTPPVRASSEPGCSVEYYELEFQRWYCLYESPDVVDDGNGVNADASADPAQDAQDAPNSPSDADSLASPYPEDYADPTAYQTQLAITPGLAELAALASGHHTYDIRTVYAGEASGVTYLMRWGSTRFGYRHLVHRRRWSARTDARIALAFSQPYSKSYQGTSTNFYVYVQGSHKCLFKVVYQNAITTHDNRPKGLITAYAVVGTGCS
jgi:hypothetical protein